MAEFNTQQAQERWNSLGKGDQATIDKIMRGQGTMQDFRKIQSLIGRYDRLASKIFNQAVEALGIAAQSRVDGIASRRSDRGKPLDEEQLTRLLDLANKRAWDDAGPELVVIIEESMASQLAQQDERLSTMFGDKLAEALPEKSKWEEAFGNGPNGPLVETRWNERIEDLKHWIEDELRRFDNFEQRVGAASGAAVKSVLDAWGIDGVFDGGATGGVGGTTTTGGNRVNNDPILGKNYTTETLNKISDSLDDIASDTNEDEEREQKKANIWWRSLKALGGFGAGLKNAAKSLFGNSFFGKMATLVGGLLVTELLGGQVLKKIGEFLDQGKLQEWGEKFLTFISSNAKKLTDWIVNKFKSASEERDEKAGVQENDPERLKEAKRDLLKMKAALEHGSQYWGTTPEDNAKLIKEAKERIAKQEKEIKEMEEGLAPATGKIGAAPEQTSGASGGGGGGAGAPITSITAAAPSAGTVPTVDSTTSSAGPLTSKGAGNSTIPGLGSGTTDTRMGDPATSMYTINETPTFNVGNGITSVPAAPGSNPAATNSPTFNGSNTSVNLSNFRRNPGDDLLTLMNMGMYTN